MRERILQTNPLWSPYPDGRIREACRDIERDASFFMGGFGEEFDLPPLPAYQSENLHAITDWLDARKKSAPIDLLEEHTERMPSIAGSFVMLARDDAYRAARVRVGGLIVKDREPDATDEELIARGETVLEMGLANTEAVRVSEPYVSLELADIPSDGIPYAIGADESTTPKTAPKSSTAVRFTESENLFGAANHGGMKW
jgi:hypothetical protein